MHNVDQSEFSLEKALSCAGKTFLAELPAESLRRLMSESMAVQIPARTVIYRPGEASKMLLIRSGEGRMILDSEDGRRLVVRHFGPDEVIGLVACLGGPVDLTVESMDPLSAYLISSRSLFATLEKDPAVGALFSRQCALRVYGLLDELGSMAFDSVYRRLIRQLLKIGRNPDQPVVVRITQQELADSIATSREVVARNLKQLRDRGWVENHADSPGLIHLLDPVALRQEYGE